MKRPAAKRPDGVLDLRKVKTVLGGEGRAHLTFVIAYSAAIAPGSERYEAIRAFAANLKAPAGMDHSVMFLPVAPLDTSQAPAASPAEPPARPRAQARTKPRARTTAPRTPAPHTPAPHTPAKVRAQPRKKAQPKPPAKVRAQPRKKARPKVRAKASRSSARPALRRSRRARR